MSCIKIRKMNKKDIDQIMKIESVSFGNFFWTPEAFASEIENQVGHYFSAENENGQLIGYCGFWLILEEAHITTIAVHPDHRKSGIGEFLLQKMLETGYEKNVKWFTLEVRASNIAAQNLYYKYNFKSLGLRRKYYQDNEEDAVIMWTENIWDSQYREFIAKLKKDLDQRVKA